MFGVGPSWKEQRCLTEIRNAQHNGVCYRRNLSNRGTAGISALAVATVLLLQAFLTRGDAGETSIALAIRTNKASSKIGLR
jgi:hypothetical protein